MTEKQLYYLILLADNLFYEWRRRKQEIEEMNEDQLNEAIAEEENKKADGDIWLASH